MDTQKEIINKIISLLGNRCANPNNLKNVALNFLNVKIIILICL